MTKTVTPVRYLIDSNWVIDVLRNHPGSLAWIEERLVDGIGISVISIAELYVGPHRRPNPQVERQRVADQLLQFTELPVDVETCEIFGRIKARLQLAGNTIEDFDTMIAATALQHDLTLLSNNRKHFNRVDGLTLDPA